MENTMIKKEEDEKKENIREQKKKERKIESNEYQKKKEREKTFDLERKNENVRKKQ